MSVELINLEPNQHQLTFVPKISSDLPFFNLTYKRKEVPTVIKYQGVDEEGRNMRWEVYQDTSEEIGPPGVEAHQVWYMLVKPAIDANRNASGKSLELIPLGGMRECLRKVCWSAGGRQAKELMKALTQISFAGCIADLWLPTGKSDEQGKKSYLQIKGRFSRLSVYAIGEHHLTDDELKAASFEFDLEDIIYIKLDPLEAKLQQAENQRPFENRYMFSVAPIGRRWLEMMGAKIYGVIKKNGEYCEVRYSWYLQHDHTLKRQFKHGKVTEQMNRVVQGHLDSGYLKKVTYRPIKEPGKEIDFIIRYYPGQGAKDYIQRIATLLRHGGTATALPHLTDETQEHVPGEQPLPFKRSSRAKQRGKPHPEVDEEYLAGMISRGVGERNARQVLSKIAPDQPVLDQLEWYDHQLRQAPPGKYTNPPGLLVSMVEQNLKVPESFETSRKRAERVKVRTEQETQSHEANLRELAYDDYRRSAFNRYINEVIPKEEREQLIDACRQELLKNPIAAYRTDEQLKPYLQAALQKAVSSQVALLTFEEFCAQVSHPANQVAVGTASENKEPSRALMLPLPDELYPLLELIQRRQQHDH